MAKASPLPPGLLICTETPSICPSCGHPEVEKRQRSDGAWRVTCQRGDRSVCDWWALYELKPGGEVTR
jgi:hypothetical protein